MTQNCDPGYDYLTGSRVIHRKACYLHSIIVTPDGTNASYASLYDGKDTTSPQVAEIRVGTTASVQAVFNPPLRLNRGLYIAFETNLEAVTVVTSNIPI